MVEQYIHIIYVTFSILQSICDLGVGLNLKQRQRQNTDGFSCKFHLLTLELIYTLYHNTWYHNFEDKTAEKNWSKTQKKNPIIIKIHLMTLHSNIFISPIKSHILLIKSDQIL